MAQIDEDTGMTQQHMALEAKWLSGEDVSGEAAYSALLYPKGVGPIRHEEAASSVRARVLRLDPAAPQLAAAACFPRCASQSALACAALGRA